MSDSKRAEHNRRIARLGGLAFAASHDPVAATAKARATFLKSFADEVRLRFPDLVDPDEVERRAQVLRKLHYAQLAYRSAVARAKRGRET